MVSNDIAYSFSELKSVMITENMFFFYFKDWTKKSGWNMYHGRVRIIPGDPGFPELSARTKYSDYASKGFKKSAI